MIAKINVDRLLASKRKQSKSNSVLFTITFDENGEMILNVVGKKKKQKD
jgi:hypothetical protein